ncbi:MAG: hypothetical protein Q4C10_09025 [Clostridia bacterium]|nr:hypothetical protein [Clostridia bacterium]
MEFKPRTLPPGLEENTTPEEQMALLIRRKRVQEEKLIARIKAEQKSRAELLTQLALDIHRKRHYPYADSFRSLSAILEKAGVRIVTYEGEDLTDRMREELNIVQWLPPNGDPLDRVVEAFEPEIYVDEAIVHRARLICREGGAAVEPESPVVEPEPSAAETSASTSPKTPPKNLGSVSRKRLKKKKKAGRR